MPTPSRTTPNLAEINPRLHEFTDPRIQAKDYSHDLLVMKVQMDQIGEAVRTVVPQSMWAAIVKKLEELEQHSGALGAVEDGFDDSYDDPYDPTEFIDEDDEF